MKTAKKPKKAQISTASVQSQSNLPAPKRDFLASLDGWKYNILDNYIKSDNINIGYIADKLCIDKTEVAVAMRTDKVFKKAYSECRKILDLVELMRLESISTANAETPSAVTERIFRLKSLSRDRYADRGRIAPSNIDIKIEFGSGVPDLYNSSTVSTESKEKPKKTAVDGVIDEIVSTGK